jgi:hypothetical protein
VHLAHPPSSVCAPSKAYAPPPLGCIPWGSFMPPRALLCPLELLYEPWGSYMHLGLLYAPSSSVYTSSHACGLGALLCALGLLCAPKTLVRAPPHLCTPLPSLTCMCPPRPVHATFDSDIPPSSTRTRPIRCVLASWIRTHPLGSKCSRLGFLNKHLKHELAIVEVAWQPP